MVNANVFKSNEDAYYSYCSAGDYAREFLSSKADRRKFIFNYVRHNLQGYTEGGNAEIYWKLPHHSGNG